MKIIKIAMKESLKPYSPGGRSPEIPEVGGCQYGVVICHLCYQMPLAIKVVASPEEYQIITSNPEEVLKKQQQVPPPTPTP